MGIILGILPISSRRMDKSDVLLSRFYDNFILIVSKFYLDRNWLNVDNVRLWKNLDRIWVKQFQLFFGKNSFYPNFIHIHIFKISLNSFLIRPLPKKTQQPNTDYNYRRTKKEFICTPLNLPLCIRWSKTIENWLESATKS